MLSDYSSSENCVHWEAKKNGRFSISYVLCDSFASWIEKQQVEKQCNEKLIKILLPLQYKIIINEITKVGWEQ